MLLYGHMDKQPEFTGWLAGLGPWESVIRDGKLYGRGAADDGYAVFSSLTAIDLDSEIRCCHDGIGTPGAGPAIAGHRHGARRRFAA